MTGTQSPGSRKIGFWGVVLVLAAAAALWPVAGVLLHRFAPVGVTFLMAQRAVEGEAYQRSWRPLNRIDPDLVTAVIAAEDAKFCSHYGFDLEAIEKALAHNERRPNRLRGGSTITQQTAKNVFLWPGRGWVRKGLEAWYAVLIESAWPKRRIMEVYLNVVEWGPGVYGAEAAARHWYGKSAETLSVREAARLAAVLPSPRRYRADRPGPYVQRRTARIVAAMGTIRAEKLDACARP